MLTMLLALTIGCVVEGAVEQNSDMNRLHQTYVHENDQEPNETDASDETDESNESDTKDDINESIEVSLDGENVLDDMNDDDIDARPYMQYNQYTDSLMIDPEFLMKGYEALNAGDYALVRGAIIPHHTVACPMIADCYLAAARVAEREKHAYDLIVVISPNHDALGSRFQVVTEDYFTYEGRVVTDSALAYRLAAHENIDVASRDMIEQEHGQLVHMNYIARYFPGVKVLSVVIAELRDEEGIAEFVETFWQSTETANILFIASIDFSHYLTLEEANEMDAFTRTCLENNDPLGLIDKSNDYIDSPSSYMILVELLKRFHAEGQVEPTVANHSNSAIVMHDPWMMDTTSYFQVLYH